MGSLQSQASERLQSPEKLIHKLLGVLTAGGAAGERHPLNVNHGNDIVHLQATGTMYTHVHMQPTDMKCLCEDQCALHLKSLTYR